jgi:cytochrome c biogenesis protein ResB
VVGNVFPIVPVHLLGPAVTVVGVIGWAFMRKHAAHRLFVCARVMAEGVRAQIALNKMGIDRRAVDLLRFRSGPISTTLRELLRSLGPAQPERAGDYADCAGWLTEQVQYYTGSAVLRQSQFVRREWIRKQVLVGGGTVILAMAAFAQTIAWLADLTIPRQMTTFVLAFTVAIMMIGVLMGLHTQQMQLRDQGESFARMREVLLTYRDWMQAAGNAQNDHTNQQKSDAAQWVLAQAMAEHEDWCLRHANPVG